VARGLLRKGDSTKSAAPATSAAAPVKTPASAPVARPAAPAVAKPTLSPSRPVLGASASSAPVVRDSEVHAIKDSVLAAAPVLPVANASETHPTLKSAVSPPSFWLGSGAASAPAPAKEILDIPPVEVVPAGPPSEDDNILETPTAEPPAAASEPAKDEPPPIFTFGGSNAPAKSGGAKKIFLGIAAAVLVAAGVYAGWTYYQGHATQPISNPAPAKVATPPAAPKPSGAQPAPAAPTAAPSSQSSAQPAASTPASATSATSDDNSDSTPDEDATPASTKPSASASSAPSKTASATKPAPAAAPAPLVVKGGAAPPAKAMPAAPDAPAPSLIGIAAPGANGPLPNLGGSDTASRPVLQRLNVSQGVSQGLLVKKVDPVYPASALSLRIEGAVELLATISKNGDISQVQVLSGDKKLTGAAVDAVKRWKYKPYLLNGEPVEIQTQVTIHFRLPH